MRPCIIAIAFFLSFASNAATVVGNFSDWYWANGKPNVDYNFTSITLDPSDGTSNGDGNIHSTRGVYCPSAWGGCQLYILTNTTGPNSSCNVVSTVYNISLPRDSEWHDFYEINKLIRDKMPIRGTLKKQNNCQFPAVWVELSNGFDHLLASSRDGSIPLDPLPPVNVFCRVDGLSNNELDFGIISQESAVTSITASLVCDGDYASQATARLLFTDANRSGKNSVVLTNSQNKQQIKAILSIDSPGGGNKKDVTVKVGYKSSVNLFASIDVSEIKKETSGDFIGSAVIVFNVI